MRRKPEKQITLLAVSILVLAVFFLLPPNGTWMAERIVPYWKEWQWQKNDLSEEGRKTTRYRGAYTYSKQIAANFTDKKNVLVLLPPEAYFKKQGLDYEVPEPAVFYYFTGLKTTWANSPAAVRANWIVAWQGKLVVRPVTDSSQLRDSINSFRKFSYGL